MNTKAKKDETAEGAEPEVKTSSAVAEGNAQNAENVAAAVEESAKADDKATKDRDALSKRLDALESQQRKLDEQMAKVAEERAALAQQLDQPKRLPARIKLRSTALNPQKALAKIADIWPKETHVPAPSVVVGRIYRVTPLGSASAELPIAEIANCADEGDAKAAYARATNRHVAVEVEEIGREEYTRPTADPVVAVT